MDELALFRALPDPASLMTPGGRHVDVNPAAEKCFKRSQEEIIGTKIEELCEKKDLQKIRDALEEAKRTGFSSCAATCIRRDNTTFPAFLYFAPVKDEWGNIINILGTITDIRELKRKERESRAEKERDIFFAASDPSCIVDVNGVRIECNPAMEEITGLPRAEFIGKPADTIFKKEDRPDWRRTLENVMKTGRANDLTPTILTKKGEKIPVSAHIHERIDADGNLIGVIVNLKDVSKLKRREEELKLILDNAPVGIMRFDENGMILYENPVMEKILGIPEGERSKAIGVKITDMPNINRTTAIGWEKAMLSGKHFNETMPFTSLYGKESVLSIDAVPLLDEEGTVNGTLALIKDITESKEREKELRESRQNYYELVEGANSIIMRMDTKGTITFINRFAEELFDYTREELIGQNIVGTIVPEIESTGIDLRKMILDIARNPEKYKFNVNENIRKNGERVWISWTNEPVFDEQGRVAGVMCIGNNITELRRMGEALRYQAEIERLVTAISTNFINLAPDKVDDGINQALQAIGEFAQVDRSYIFLLSEDGKKVSNTHEWCAEGVASQIDNLKDLPAEAFPWREKLNRFEIIHIPRVADLPPEARAEKKILELQDIQSLIILPMVYGGSLIGFLGFDSVRSEKTWPEEITVLLKTVGGIFANALEHKRLHGELEANRIYFQNFFDLSPVPLTLIGLDGKRLDCNPAMERLTGKNKEELINVPVEVTYAKEEQPLVRKKLVDETIEKGYMYGFETYFMKPDGTRLPTVTNCSLLRDEEGKPLSIICSTIDITELQKRETELKESNEFNRLLVENLPATIVIFDEESRISFVNKEFVRLSGWKKEEITGKMAANVPYSKPPYVCESGLPYMEEGTVEALRKIWKRTLERGEIASGEVPFSTKDGRIVIHHGTEIPYGKGRLWVSMDVTALKKREKKLKN